MIAQDMQAWIAVEEYVLAISNKEITIEVAHTSDKATELEMGLDNADQDEYMGESNPEEELERR